ncbi:MAG: ribosomal L7Ae/L30e/S12e/Gadd45 family protein [Oscillospiraceae bacterium]|jgi:ribosomal protein L7Ae-like RNA K-turn-binding protein|nr:ribosomal L7Ae/L30e/S12e/Gadd45 family protein [Oscillospiraceae bacterium]
MNSLNDGFLSFLGLAKKAGKLYLGFSSAVSCIKYGFAKLVLVTNDLSKNTFKKVSFLADQNNICIKKVKISMVCVEKALGKKSGIIILTDQGFSNRILDFL